MGSVRVVMLDVLGEHGLEVVAADDEHSVEALAPDGADHPLARGARMGVLMMLVPSAAKTASKEAVNFVSRLRMRNLIEFAWSASSIEMLRACWVSSRRPGSK